MDKPSLKRFQQVLSGRRDEQLKRLNAANRDKGEAGFSEAKDEADRATASSNAELSIVQRAQAEKSLEMINAALARIEAGTYGECLNCGQEIGLKRLEAIPWARYCITCQELLDTH
jgi:DnaK suppressor protein